MPTTYSLTRSASTATEGGQVTFTITRSGDLPSETVYFSTLSDGTATYGEGDYSTTSGGAPSNIPITFSSGATSRTITLNILNDGTADSGEQFRAIVQRNASDPVSVYLDRSSYVTINDAVQTTTYDLTPSVTSVTEGNQVTFTITRSGNLPSETIYFSTLSDGTATYGEGDYTTTSGGSPSNIAVTFSSGATTRTVTINIANDGTADSGEQFRAIIQRNSSDPVSTYLDRSSYVTINDAAQSTSYDLTSSVSTVVEGNQVTFTITRSGDLPAETLYFSTLSDGTATYAEGDYTTTSGGQPANIAVTFSAGATTRTVTLNILNDGTADSGEQFRAIVQRNSSDPVTTYLDRSGFVTINDAAAATSYELTSPTSATEGGQVTFTITRTGTLSAETIYFSTLSDGTATYAEGDYTTTSGGQPANIAVTFAAGVATQTVTLNVISDGANDGGEQFRAIIQRNTSDPVTTYLDRSDFVTINDATAGTSYGVSVASSVTEGGQLTFTITRSGATPAETVYFSTLGDGTATYAEGDYATTGGGTPLNMPVTFAAGATSRTVTININADGISDSGEQFRAIVQRNASDSATTFLTRSDFVTINDTAQSTTYTLVPNSIVVTEGGQVTFTVTRSGATPGETIYFSTLSDGTATFAEGDYSTTSGAAPANIPIVFTAGQTTRTITLDIREDNLPDSGEQFRAIIQRNASDPVSVSLDRSGYVRIEDAPEGPGENLLSVAIVHAAEVSTGTVGIRFPVGDGWVTEGRFDDDYYNANDFGVETDDPSSLNGHSGHFHDHLGEDWNADGRDDTGDPVFAMYAGRVVYAGQHVRADGTNGPLGNVVVIAHEINGATVYSLYAHLNAVNVSPGSTDFSGPIGTIGTTGGVPAHLHFEVLQGDWEYYLYNGADGLWSYAEEVPDGQYTYSANGRTVTWFDPSEFIAQTAIQEIAGDPVERDTFQGLLDDLSDAFVSLRAWGGNVLVNTRNAVQWLLQYFEEIRIVGGSRADTLHVGNLTGTTIDQNTVYFDGGAGADVLDASTTDRRIVAEGGLDNDRLTGGSAGDYLDGGAGQDQVFGGGGNDVIVWDAADDLANVQGGDGFDTLVFTSGGPPVSFGLGAHGFEAAEGRYTVTGATYTDFYDVQWRLSEQRGEATNGSSWYVDWDEASTLPYQRLNQDFNASGQLAREYGLADSGSTWNQYFDVANNQPWVSLLQVHTAGGVFATESGVADNGSTWTRFFDVDGTNPFVWIEQVRTAGGVLAQEEGLADVGSRWFRDFDETGTADFQWYENIYDSSNRLTSQTGLYDNGHTWLIDYDETDAYAWASRRYDYDSNGVLIGTTEIPDGP